MQLEDWLISDLLSPQNNSPWFLFTIGAFSFFGITIACLPLLFHSAAKPGGMLRLGLILAPISGLLLMAFAISTPLTIGLESDLHVLLAYVTYVSLLVTFALILLGSSRGKWDRFHLAGLLQVFCLVAIATFYLMTLSAEPDYGRLAIFQWCLNFCVLLGIWITVRNLETSRLPNLRTEHDAPTKLSPDRLP